MPFFCTFSYLQASVTNPGGSPNFLQFDLLDGAAGCTLAGSDDTLLRRYNISTTTATDGFGTIYYPADGLHGGPPNLAWTSNQRVRVPILSSVLKPTGSWTLAHINDGFGAGDYTLLWSPPVANDQSLTTYAETPLAIVLTGVSGAGAPGPQVFTVATSPTHGMLTGVVPNLTYTPDANWIGTDSFTFTMNDGTNDSDTGTITIDTYPIVTGISPVTGPEAGGTPVTLSGRGLHNTSTIAFGAAAATGVVVAGDGHSIACVSPAHVPGLVSVVDTGPNHTASSPITAAQNFTYYHVPDVNGSPPWQTVGQWALHRFDMRPRKEGPA